MNFFNFFETSDAEEGKTEVSDEEDGGDRGIRWEERKNEDEEEEEEDSENRWFRERESESDLEERSDENISGGEDGYEESQEEDEEEGEEDDGDEEGNEDGKGMNSYIVDIPFRISRIYLIDVKNFNISFPKRSKKQLAVLSADNLFSIVPVINRPGMLYLRGVKDMISENKITRFCAKFFWLHFGRCEIFLDKRWYHFATDKPIAVEMNRDSSLVEDFPTKYSMIFSGKASFEDNMDDILNRLKNDVHLNDIRTDIISFCPQKHEKEDLSILESSFDQTNSLRRRVDYANEIKDHGEDVQIDRLEPNRE